MSIELSMLIFFLKKYFFVISGIITVSFMVLGSLLTMFTFRYWRNERCDSLTEIAETVGKAVKSAVDENSLEISSMNIYSLSNYINLLSIPLDTDIFVSDMSGQIIICKHTAYASTQSFECVHMKNSIGEDVIDELRETGSAATGVLYNFNREQSYSSGVPIIINGQMVGAVFATTPNSSVRPYVNDILQIFLVSMAFALLIAFVSSYFLTYKMVDPLRKMVGATRKFAKGDFSERVNVSSHDELGELVEAFNVMALSLATLESTRRSFIANVSHELRTPMTTIGGFIDGIRDGTIPPEQHDHYLQIVSDEIKRLSRLVIQMLNMSEIEAGKKKIQATEFDISERIFRVFLSFEKRIEDKMIEIRGFEDMPHIKIEADPDMIHQCIYNLVDNAIKFTNEGGYIQVLVAQEQKYARISIRNSGEGLSPEEAHRVFERFYKVDKSRSKDVKGTGIGLYIVKSVVELHGGKIVVNSTEGEYCEFTFWLPMTQKSEQE